MIRFENHNLELLRLLAEDCSGKTGFATPQLDKDGKVVLVPVITGHTLFARIARERLHNCMSSVHFNIIDYCAGECIRQDDGDVPMATFDMVNAYDFALGNLDPAGIVSLAEIKQLFKLMKPLLNPFGFRSVPVFVKGREIPAESLNGDIGQLCEAQRTMSPEEFFLWLEYYHPGRDGNGRVGAILFNLKTGTLEAPVVAPMYRDPTKLPRESAFGEIEP